MAHALRILELCSARQYVGEAAHVVDRAEALILQGHAVEIAARRSFRVLEEAGKRGLPCLPAHMESRFRPFRDLADIRCLRKRIRAFRPHVVHAHRGKDHWLAALSLYGLSSRPVLIRTRHVMTPIRTHLANRWLFGSATQGLLCVSRAVAREVARAGGILRAPVEVVPGGVNLRRLGNRDPQRVEALRRRLGVPAGAAVVSCLARLAPVKGQEHLLRAIPRIRERHPGTIFLFAFPRASDYRARLESLVEEARIEEAVRWADESERVPDVLGLSDIGVLPSIGSEGWSRATVEFLSFGVPVVATRVGCLPEIVREGETGRLVPPGDPGALAAAVNDLLDRPEDRRRMGRAGREGVLREYTIERTAEGVLAFYQRLLDRSPLASRVGSGPEWGGSP
ncbi:MAG: glycosyltransferase family 4 protein [Planctomycetota bacterium]